MATARDVVLIAVIVFIIGMGLFVINYFTNTAVDALVAIPEINSTDTARQAFEDTRTVANDRFDYVVFGLFLGLVFGFIIAGYYVGGEPIFMFFYFLITAIGVIVSMVLANVWNDMTTQIVFGVTVTYMPITNNLMHYLPIYTSIIGVLGIIIMFIKPVITRQ